MDNDQEVRKLKIMTVDDEPEIIRSIERYLRFQPQFGDVEFISANTFENALEKLEQDNPAIVFQDINLPDGNGLQFIKQAKKKYPMIQFIVITGASDLDRAMEALSFGAIDYVKKPLSMDLMGKIAAEAKERCDRWGELLWEEYLAEEEAGERSSS
ncbi:MAG: response regulator [Magnetococcales bacterium]|nr:response regulator [Magnetococcales bacterium]MBF0149174.1 response regulator [Magnetococcales bacterium]MBF0174993.1 response regulator [Magnetococcales bacterium]MBF0629633.1 response regulator [Magnetococcales bacterium]